MTPINNNNIIRPAAGDRECVSPALHNHVHVKALYVMTVSDN